MKSKPRAISVSRLAPAFVYRVCLSLVPLLVPPCKAAITSERRLAPTTDHDDNRDHDEDD